VAESLRGSGSGIVFQFANPAEAMNILRQRGQLDQAIAAYTTGSAYAEFAEREKGLLQPGMLADFVVLDRDITRVEPGDIPKTRVLRTVVGGKTAYELSH
jgi:predicted amidohydrolase YtcJ